MENLSLTDEIIYKLKEKKYLSPNYEFFLVNLFNSHSIDDDFINNVYDSSISNYYSNFNYDNSFVLKEKILLFNIVFEIYIRELEKANISENPPKVDTIFTSFIYFSPDYHINNIKIIYEKLSYDEREKVNKRFIIFIFYKVLSIIFEYESCTNILDKDDEYTENILDSIQSFVLEMINLKIISNPIYSTDNDDDDEDDNNSQQDNEDINIIPSFYDIFIYITNCFNSENLNLFWFNLLVNLINKDLNILDEFIVTRPNTTILESLVSFINHDESDNFFDLIDKINSYDEKNKFDIYTYYPLYWINKLYLKYNTPSNFQHKIILSIDKFYQNIFDKKLKLINFTSEFETIEITRFLYDIYTINSDVLFDIIINNLSQSIIPDMCKVYIMSIILRCVYYPQILLFDRINNNYYTKSEQNISTENFIIKVAEWLDSRTLFFKQNILELMHNYINKIYPEIINKEKELLKNNPEPDCVICYESIKKNIIICKGCSNYYHLKCLIQWSKTKHYKKCPVCQRFLNNVIFVNKDEHYIVYSRLIEIISK